MKRLPVFQTPTARPASLGDVRQAGSWLLAAAWLPPGCCWLRWASGLAVAGLPARFRELVANTGQPLLAPQVVAGLMVGMNVLLAGLFSAAALWIVRLKGRSPLALFLSLTLIVLGATETGLTGALVNPEHGVDSALLRWLAHRIP
jgi:hypothetical protein